MGSSFSVLNDTEHDVWVDWGVNYKVMVSAIAASAALLSGGMALAALGASIGVGGVLLGGGSLILFDQGIVVGTSAATIVGLTSTQWTLAGIVASGSAAAVAEVLNITEAEADKLTKAVTKFQKGATLIKSGESFKFKGTLGLTMSVYVMNDILQMESRSCWTGAKVNSKREYPISQYFPKLNVKKGPKDTISVYSKK